MVVDAEEEQDRLDLGLLRSLAVTSRSPLLCWFSVRTLVGRTGCWGGRWERKDSALLRTVLAQKTTVGDEMIAARENSRRRLLRSIFETF